MGIAQRLLRPFQRLTHYCWLYAGLWTRSSVELQQRQQDTPHASVEGGQSRLVRSSVASTWLSLSTSPMFCGVETVYRCRQCGVRRLDSHEITDRKPAHNRKKGRAAPSACALTALRCPLTRFTAVCTSKRYVLISIIATPFCLSWPYGPARAGGDDR